MNPGLYLTTQNDVAQALSRTLRLRRIGATQPTLLPTPGLAIDPRIRRAETIMHHNLGRKLYMNELAGKAGISVSRLSHLFKSQTGVSARQLLKSLRLRLAQDLLENSSLSVKEVAAEVGLTAGALIREFRRTYGHTPGRHRWTSLTASDGIALSASRTGYPA
jgi:AraC family transcriptional regulator, arabinose operon regulatory protein